VVIKSGEFKDMGSPTKEMSRDEKQLLQAFVDQAHRQFVTAIAEGRNMDIDHVQSLADGRIYTGEEAVKQGLVDRLGNLEGARHPIDGDILVADSVPLEAIERADAAVIITEWPQFASLDYKAILDSMVQPAFIFDGRNILNHSELYELGFNVYAVGKPPLTNFPGAGSP